VKTRGQGTLDIALDALDKCKMWLLWIMHKQADLLDNIGDVRMSKSKILQSTSNTPILRRTRNRRSM